MKYLLNLLIIFLFIIYKLKKCSSKCSFNKFDLNAPPLFLAKFQEDSYSFLGRVEEGLTVENNLEVIAYCPTGIELIQNGKKLKSTTTEIIFLCKHSKLTLTVGNDSYLSSDSDEMISCSDYGKIRLVERLNSDGCDKRNYAIITYIADLLIILGESCFDLNKMKISHLHYRTRSSGSLFFQNTLSSIQEKHLRKTTMIRKSKNHMPHLRLPENVELSKNAPYNIEIPQILPKKSTQKHKILQTTIPLKTFFYSDNDTQLLFANEGEGLIFVVTDLFPSDVYEPYFSNPFKNYTILQRFIGWPNIVNGNWKSFHKLLLAHSRATRNYEVYLGISHTAIAPNRDDQCVKKIQLELGVKKLYVPKYIWAYVKSSNKDEEFVVLGVNSPYYKYYDVEKDITCKDICEDITWLSPLYASRKVLTFGYMLCCPVDTVHQHLDGFPNLKKDHDMTFE